MTNPYQTPAPEDNVLVSEQAGWTWKAEGWKAVAVWVLSLGYGASSLAFVFLTLATIQQAIECVAKGWPDLFFSGSFLSMLTAIASAMSAGFSFALYRICREIKSGRKALASSPTQPETTSS